MTITTHVGKDTPCEQQTRIEQHCPHLIMNPYTKKGLTGTLGYLLIQTVACIFGHKPGTSIIATASDSVILCTMAGPLMWIPLLIFPIVALVIVFGLLKAFKHTASASLISSTIILYGIGLVFGQYAFGLFDKSGPQFWKLIQIAGISAVIGLMDPVIGLQQSPGIRSHPGKPAIRMLQASFSRVRNLFGALRRVL